MMRGAHITSIMPRPFRVPHPAGKAGRASRGRPESRLRLEGRCRLGESDTRSETGPAL